MKLAPCFAGADVLVLALPRGGVPVAFEIAKALHAPLDISLVRKLGVPGQEELAMGAVAAGNIGVLDQAVIRALAISEADVDRVTRKELHELSILEGLYRGRLPKREVRDRSVILVDDGLATGASMRAASLALKQQRPARIAAAVPVVAGPRVAVAAGQEVPVYGPGKVPIELSVNGQTYKTDLEPRVTLLDALRDSFDITGAKRVCDRGECGACTVLLGSKPVYACSILAIEAQGKKITTVESLMQGGRLHPLQQAFVDNDGSQCGFCTPGFVMACKALLDEHPNPSPDDLRRGLSGNFCRCGTYAGIRAAIAQVAQKGA